MTTGVQPELRWHAIGRRKTSVARVYLTPGSGKWDVNGRTLGDYFPRRSLVQHIQDPFATTDTLGAFDVSRQASPIGKLGLHDRSAGPLARQSLPNLFRDKRH